MNKLRKFLAVCAIIAALTIICIAMIGIIQGSITDTWAFFLPWPGFTMLVWGFFYMYFTPGTLKPLHTPAIIVWNHIGLLGELILLCLFAFGGTGEFGTALPEWITPVNTLGAIGTWIGLTVIWLSFRKKAFG